MPIVGSDESGKGDYFGPLVAAAVYVDKEMAEILKSSGVRDSKDLPETKIADLAATIPKIVGSKLAVIEISPEKYNELYQKFASENKNLNMLLAWGHAKAIEVVLSKVECKHALADQFADERFILSKLQERGKRIDLHQMPKAETNVAVAAASILARHRFVSRLSELSNRFGIELPRGTSQQTISAAKAFVNIHGISMLGKVAKLHFKTTEIVIGKK
ncbi:MAG: ribonuclease HIII [Deltaproteobacteria bacterium RBG_16_54_11]|nr:MAG: ribonuclease HIII [Deltaproteobacteria bacterium RBG_16_54_11]